MLPSGYSSSARDLTEKEFVKNRIAKGTVQTLAEDLTPKIGKERRSDGISILAKILTAISSGFAEGIVRNDFETPTAEGNYRWALQTEEGIYHEQQGTSTEEGLSVQGQYQYTAPDGQIINVVYRADGSGGFKAEGAHLPTPPPIPPAIQRALDYLARLETQNNRI